MVLMPAIENDDATTRRRKPRLTIDSGDNFDTSVEKAGLERSKKKKRRSRRDEIDPPFHVLVLQVGTTLFILCLVSFHLYRTFVPNTPPEVEIEVYDDDLNQNLEENGLQDAIALPVFPTAAPTKPTPPPLPVWKLGNGTRYDAFGIAELFQKSLPGLKDGHSSNQAFWEISASIRSQFSDSYGGENAVRAMLERSMTTFHNVSDNSPPGDLITTACRIWEAKQEGRPFKITFGGYSVTVGRGNYFSQSFPFVMRRLLDTPFQMLGVNLVVENAAIGGCPSFPYGFCKKNHWGEDSDVVSWDFSMNEAGGVAEGLEAYLRHTMTLSRRPKLIVKDTVMADKRRDMLETYVKMGAIQDPVVLHSDPGARPFLQRPEEFRPPGFQDWRKFGSPAGAPGQALHHPAVKEHELVGWILALHFLGALEMLAAVESDARDQKLQITCPSMEETKQMRQKRNLLPPPVTTDAASMQEWSSLFFGVPTSSDAIIASPSRHNNENWKMNPVHCKTTYDPIVNESGSLTSIVVAGSTGEDMELMLPKGHMFYNKAWVLDLTEGEKDAKRKLDRFGGLGFIDTKKAYRGLFTSGSLRLLVPYYGGVRDAVDNISHPKPGDSARDWFQTVVVCEVNERREPGACQVGKDITFKVGGVNATNITMLDTPGTLYLGKKICAFVRVPDEAKLTTREDMLLDVAELPDDDKRKRKARDRLITGNTTLGLSLELSVHNHRIIAREKACSISHVVWEERNPGDPRFPLLKETPDSDARPDQVKTDKRQSGTRKATQPLETRNVEGEAGIKPLKDYVSGVKQ